MTRRRRVARSAAFALLLPTLAMTAPAERLLVGLGTRVVGVSLQTGRQALVAELPAGSAGTLAEAGPHGLLISDNAAGNLYLADPATGNVQLLRQGTHAIYVRELDALVFYATLGGAPGLWIVGMSEPAAPPRRLDSELPALRQRPVQISPTELLVLRAHRSELHTAAQPDAVAKIDLLTGEVAEQPGLADCRVIPVWRARAQQVACWARDPVTGGLTGEALLSSLDGAVHVSLPRGRIPIAVTPADEDLIVATAGEADGERWSLERYLPASGKLEPLAIELPVRAEAVAWEVVAEQ